MRTTVVKSAGMLAAIALAASPGAAAAARGPAAGSSAARAASPIVLAPRAGSRLRARPVTVTVRAGHATSVSASLNGRSVRDRFGPSSRGRRSIVLSPTHGLRYGRNVLRVRTRTGRRVRSRTVTFTELRTGPLAAAGHDLTATGVREVRLDGGRSLHHTGAPTRLRYRWSVVRAPRGVKLSDGGTRIGTLGATRAATSPFQAAVLTRPAFRPTQPGSYQLRLTVTGGARSSSDLMDLTVKAPPFLAVETMAKASAADVRLGVAPGARGIRVGANLYPGDASKWLQLLVLDRSTLAYVGGKDFDCPQATKNPTPGGVAAVAPCIQAVRDYLGAYDATRLVIAASQRPSGEAPSASDPWKAQPPVGVPEALTRIGVAPVSWAGGQAMLRGRISAIGVPSYPSGSATVHAESNLGDQSRTGDVDGYLTRDNNLHYAYTSDRPTYETQAAGSGATQNVIQVGDQKFTVPTPWGSGQSLRGGFQVVVLDRTNPAVGAQSQFFPTGQGAGDSNTPGRLEAMTAFLKQANDSPNKLVIVSSRGNSAFDQERADRWDQAAIDDRAASLVTELEHLGGTRTAAYQAIVPYVSRSGFSYTLVGTSNAGAGKGIEQQGNVATPSGGLNTAPLTGTLSRDTSYRWSPGESNPSSLHVEKGTVTEHVDGHVAGDKLTEVLYSPPSNWPEQGNAGREAAIAYLSRSNFVGSDVRTQYWDQAHGDTFWSGKRSDIEKTPYAAGNGFSPSDLAWAKNELDQEIVWLRQVDDYVKNAVGAPFTQNNLSKWADFASASNTIRDAIHLPQQSLVGSVATHVFDGAREAAGEIPGPFGKGAKVVSKLYDIALEITEMAGPKHEDAGAAFTAEANQVGTDLAKRLDAAQSTVLDRFPEIIDSDYAKLRRVAACAQQHVADCRDAAEWIIDKTDQLAASKALTVGTRVELMGALLPARYTLWQMGDSCSASLNYTCWEGNYQGDGFGGLVYRPWTVKVCPFLKEPASGKLVVPLRRDVPQYRSNAYFGGDKYDSFVAYGLGQRDGEGTVTSIYKMSVPDGRAVTDYLDPLFAPIDVDDPTKGQGLAKEAFFRRYFTPKRMASNDNAFPYTSATIDWFGRSTGCVEQP
ncbi:MAG: hypothetical protein JWQ48_3346 [Conexibacter sp.]|nr:hypothetical protein [Conexibacter sp.]